MAYKTISLSEEAYERLNSMKRERESFSSVVLRLTASTPMRSLSSFSGRWEMAEEEEREIFREIARMWERYEEGLP